ncbi:putative glycerol-3-phosphate transporter 1, partial [Tanacetum coccineum]
SGWAPFNGSNGTALLGDLDLAFLFVYLWQFFRTYGDRMKLKIFLTIGMLGTVLIKRGGISDRLDARAITAASFTYCAIPALYLYRSYGHISMAVNVILMMVIGMFVNGPYALITTAVSADLGTHKSLKGNSKALATVTAIIDGTGSIGAAIGPVLTGPIRILIRLRNSAQLYLQWYCFHR